MSSFHSDRTVRGFGLLEAIVALTLLAGSGAALFAWIAQSMQAAARLEEAQARAALQMQAQALASGSINPFLEPVGERKLANLSIRWRAQLREPVRPSVPTLAGQPVRWRVGLYQVAIEASRPDGLLQTRFDLLLPGLEDLSGAVSAVPKDFAP